MQRSGADPSLARARGIETARAPIGVSGGGRADLPASRSRGVNCSNLNSQHHSLDFTVASS
jgi:hypothetical protein